MEVHAKINESPFDAFALVLLLLEHEHVMVKELLQFLVCEVNAELLKTVELQGILTGGIKLGGWSGGGFRSVLVTWMW